MKTNTLRVVHRVVREAVTRPEFKTKHLEHVPQEIREAYLLYTKIVMQR